MASDVNQVQRIVCKYKSSRNASVSAVPVRRTASNSVYIDYVRLSVQSCTFTVRIRVAGGARNIYREPILAYIAYLIISPLSLKRLLYCWASLVRKER